MVVRTRTMNRWKLRRKLENEKKNKNNNSNSSSNSNDNNGGVLSKEDSFTSDDVSVDVSIPSVVIPMVEQPTKRKNNRVVPRIRVRKNRQKNRGKGNDDDSSHDFPDDLSSIYFDESVANDNESVFGFHTMGSGNKGKNYTRSRFRNSLLPPRPVVNKSQTDLDKALNTSLQSVPEMQSTETSSTTEQQEEDNEEIDNDAVNEEAQDLVSPLPNHDKKNNSAFKGTASSSSSTVVSFVSSSQQHRDGQYLSYISSSNISTFSPVQSSHMSTCSILSSSFYDSQQSQSTRKHANKKEPTLCINGLIYLALMTATDKQRKKAQNIFSECQPDRIVRDTLCRHVEMLYPVESDLGNNEFDDEKKKDKSNYNKPQKPKQLRGKKRNKNNKSRQGMIVDVDDSSFVTEDETDMIEYANYFIKEQRDYTEAIDTLTILLKYQQNKQRQISNKKKNKYKFTNNKKSKDLSSETIMNDVNISKTLSYIAILYLYNSDRPKALRFSQESVRQQKENVDKHQQRQQQHPPRGITTTSLNDSSNFSVFSSSMTSSKGGTTLTPSVRTNNTIMSIDSNKLLLVCILTELGLIQFACNKLNDAIKTWEETLELTQTLPTEYTQQHIALLLNNMACSYFCQSSSSSIPSSISKFDESINIQRALIRNYCSDPDRLLLQLSITLCNTGIVTYTRNAKQEQNGSDSDAISGAIELIEEALMFQESLFGSDRITASDKEQQVQQQLGVEEDEYIIGTQKKDNKIIKITKEYLKMIMSDQQQQHRQRPTSLKRKGAEELKSYDIHGKSASNANSIVDGSVVNCDRHKTEKDKLTLKSLFISSSKIFDDAKEISEKASPPPVSFSDFILLGSTTNELKTSERVRQAAFVGLDPLYLMDEDGGSYTSHLTKGTFDEGCDFTPLVQECIDTFDGIAETDTEYRGKRKSRRRKRMSLPVDVDGNVLVDAELHTDQINAQAKEHLEHGETHEAIELFDSSLRNHVEKYGKVHPLVGTALHNMGVVDLYTERYKQSLDLFIAAWNIREASLGPDHPDTMSSLNKIGLLQMVMRPSALKSSKAEQKEKENDTAYKTFSKLLTLQRNLYGNNDESIAKTLNNIGCVHYESNDLLASLKSFEEALEIQRRHCYNKNDNDVSLTSSSSLLQQHSSSPTKTTTILTQKGTAEEEDHEPTSLLLSKLGLSNILSNIGFIYVKRKEYTNALSVYEESLLIQRSVLSACSNNDGNNYHVENTTTDDDNNEIGGENNHLSIRTTKHNIANVERIMSGGGRKEDDLTANGDATSTTISSLTSRSYDDDDDDDGSSRETSSATTTMSTSCTSKITPMNMLSTQIFDLFLDVTSCSNNNK